MLAFWVQEDVKKKPPRVKKHQGREIKSKLIRAASWSKIGLPERYIKKTKRKMTNGIIPRATLLISLTLALLVSGELNPRAISRIKKIETPRNE